MHLANPDAVSAPSQAPPAPPRTWHEAYARIARQQPLPETLSLVAALTQQAWPAAFVLVFEVANSRLLPHAAPHAPSPLLRALDGLCADLPDVAAAPWWPYRGETRCLALDPNWLLFAIPSSFHSCWSRRILTPAGEVVGTLTAFLPDPLPPPPDPAQLEEIAEFAALAIEQAHLVEELAFQARHDPITGLWSRRHFNERVQHWQLTSPRDASAALLLLLLEGYRRIREILGGDTSDALIAAAAARLRAALRSADLSSRASEAEFHVLLPNLAGGAEMHRLAARILAEFALPFHIDGHEISLSASIGLAPAANSAEDLQALIRKARAALAAAQRRGPGQMAIYEPSLELLTPERLELERRLRRAIANRELLLYYQPQVRTADRAPAGVEALLRWRNPDIGFVSPGVFIPLAEEIGLIHEIGAWVLAEACRQARLWSDAGHPRRVGVNVSAIQFQAPSFVRQVLAVIESTGVHPSLLELEITESVLLADRRFVIEAMRLLRQRGVEFALDDFGTGHSSLSYLRELPVQRLKIDRSFLQELDSCPRAPLLASIIQLARSLNLPVIVEGVENQSQWDSVARLGCQEVQGFFIARPMPADLLDTWSPPSC